MINISTLLKDAPKGMKLYSPIFGNVELNEVRIDNDMPIRITRGYAVELFDEYGRYYKGFPDAECLLFPAKGQTWEGWKLPVEHQYKVHDCVVSNGQPAIIYELKKDYYLGKYLNGHDFCHKYTDEGKLHLWTIQDAKDGDVLTTESFTFIFKSVNNRNGVHYYCCYDIDNEKFGIALSTSLIVCDTFANYHPATKEQRDLLFERMKEAGYTWDEKKKELRKFQHYDIANFHAGMEVLVRDGERCCWEYVLYSHYNKDNKKCKFCAAGTTWAQCIPLFGDTEHLIGTTDMCPKEYINWEGE